MKKIKLTDFVAKVNETKHKQKGNILSRLNVTNHTKRKIYCGDISAETRYKIAVQLNMLVVD